MISNRRKVRSRRNYRNICSGECSAPTGADLIPRYEEAGTFQPTARREHARDSDVVSRYGGEEFAIVMPGCSLEEGAERAEALRQAIRQLHLTHRGRTLGTVTVSFGVAAYPEHGAGWAEITNAADHALYDAKGEGRDRVVVAKTSTPGERPSIQLVAAAKASADIKG